jgi:hypothetical protein
MQQLARLKFTSFGLTVPTNWKDPSGDPGAKHYGKAFKDNEKASSPGMPPLFQPASMNKYHTDTQKMHIAKIGKFIDDTCSAICSAWSQWQVAATMTGILHNGPTAVGGILVGPPWTPLILATAPKSTPGELKYSNVIANVIGMAWSTFQLTVKAPASPVHPQLAAFPSPAAVMIPNLVPCPFGMLIQVPTSIAAALLKTQMVSQLGDPQAPFHQNLFEAISDAFEKSYDLWKMSSLVTIMASGAVPTMATPIPVPGPIVAGVGVILPGGIA